MKIPFILGALSTTAFAAAFDAVVPPAFTNLEAPGIFSLTTSSATGRTFQWVIDSSQLTSFVNSTFKGMAFRLNNASTAWPPVPISMSFFDVFIGPGVDPTATSNTFASNFMSAATQVRNGSLSFNPGDFDASASGTTPETFGPTISFNMGSYLYSGGDLAIQVRFAQQTGSTVQSPFDAVATTDTANGYGSLFAARWATGSTNTVGGLGNFIVTRLTANPVPEPATMAVLGLGVAALLRRRRK